MKTISIKQLHAETGRWVREARKQAIIVTDRGERTAVLGPAGNDDAPRAVFRRRDWSKLPTSPVDSTIYISEERDAR